VQNPQATSWRVDELVDEMANTRRIAFLRVLCHLMFLVDAHDASGS